MQYPAALRAKPFASPVAPRSTQQLAANAAQQDQACHLAAVAEPDPPVAWRALHRYDNALALCDARWLERGVHPGALAVARAYASVA